MEQLTTRIGIEPGPGLVGRFGETVIVIPRGDAGVSPAAAGVIQELLGLAADVRSDREASANAIASQLAAWAIGHMSGDAPAFGIVAPMRDGVIMFLRGAVWCTITESGTTREISGEQALTWVDLIVPGTFERLAIGGSSGRPVQADPLSDLWGGVVPGQGFVLSRVAGMPGAPGMSGAEPASAVGASEATPAPQQSRTAAGQGPLGVLTSQDAPPIVLTGVLVLGREPSQDPAVESGEAAPVQLQDPDHVISRVHAYVSVENGIVLVRDADSMHGTYFSPPGGEQWTRIGTEPSPLPPGWSMQIGPQVFTFEPAESDSDR